VSIGPLIEDNMTKRELIAELAGIPDDCKVLIGVMFVGLQGDFYEVDCVNYDVNAAMNVFSIECTADNAQFIAKH